MLLRRLKLVNYGGIYNGLGLYEIEIDFTKCMHKIILIKGDNGSGKSTIENALKPLPDDNSAFICDRDACKEIEYLDEINNVIYSLTFIHELSGSTRKTKGYISKGLSPATMVELNPSGNITSCKDIIFEEFQLDPNYISLSQLSATKRGIADLKPADRKRYVNSILSTTDVYNNMYKTLSKKASNYKAMVQNATAKLDNIGNVVQLEQSIKSVDERIKEAEALLEKHNEILNKEKGMLEITDPDNTLRARIDNLMYNLDIYKGHKDDAQKQLNKLYRSNPSLANTDITELDILGLTKRITEIDNEYTTIKSKISMLLESRNVDAEELQAKSAKLQSLNSGSSILEARRIKSELKDKKDVIEQRWNGTIDVSAITGDEFKAIFDTICELHEMVCNNDIIITDNLDESYRACILYISNIDDAIEQLVDNNNRISNAEDKASILSQRPETCKDDTCPFIIDALKAQANLEELMQLRQSFKTMSELNAQKEEYQERINLINITKQCKNIYNANQRILKLLNFGFDTFAHCVYNLKNNITIIPTLQSMLEYVSDVDEYRSILQSIADITNRYNTLASQEDYINMLTADIEKLQKQFDSDSEKIFEYGHRRDELECEFRECTATLQLYNDIRNIRNQLTDLDEKIKMIEEEIDKNRNEIKKIMDINDDINKLNVNISELKTQLEPLKKEKSSLEYKYNLSVEYSKELNEYNAMYTKIDTLKYYCSPTTGIQLLYADMYLNNIIGQANRILAGLFGGIFALLPLVITENEFRIPVAVNGGINHDDITSMSSAQISLISMIISIALLSQTSTKLNIIVGDEIDAPFDGENRREFISILYQLMRLVNSSQCVLISHNSEIPMDDCDVILLKSVNDIFTTGNIIWSYR